MVTEIPLSSVAGGEHAPSVWSTKGRVAWEELFERAADASPFLSPVWTGEWLRTFGETLRPVQLLFGDNGGRAVGTCLLTRRSKRIGPISLRRAFLNTDGEDPGESVIIEHNATLAMTGYETEVAQQLADYVGATNVDEFVLSGLGESEVDRVREAFRSWMFEVEWRDCPYVDLARLREEQRGHLDVLSTNSRAQIRRALRAYGKRGPLGIHVARTSADADAMLSELIALHEVRWNSKGQPGAFGAARRRQFHSSFARIGVGSGESVLLRVTSGSQTIGVVYFLAAKGRINFYQAGFSYESDSTLKPGLVSHHLAIEHFRQQGYREYDFLVSGRNDGRYKLSLATDSRRLGWVTLSRRGLRQSMFSFARYARRVYANRRAVASERFGLLPASEF